MNPRRRLRVSACAPAARSLALLVGEGGDDLPALDVKEDWKGALAGDGHVVLSRVGLGVDAAPVRAARLPAVRAATQVLVLRSGLSRVLDISLSSGAALRGGVRTRARSEQPQAATGIRARER